MKKKDILQWAKAYVRKADMTSAERANALRALEAYCAGSRVPRLHLPVHGTAFQRAVWRELTRIPSGSTITYGELARRIGHPRAARAVGTALNKNPFPILLPCHRVVPAAGGIGRYAGGQAAKRRLLREELT